MYIVLNSVSLDYKLLRAETLSCNCVTCAIHIYQSVELEIIICDATDGFNGKKTKQMQILSCHMYLAKEKYCFSLHILVAYCL